MMRNFHFLHRYPECSGCFGVVFSLKKKTQNTKKNPVADCSHICILLTMEHFQVAWVKHRQWTPLGIHQPVSIQRAYGFQPFPCSLVADMQVYKLPGLCCIHRSRHPRLSAIVASLNDFSRPAVSILPYWTATVCQTVQILWFLFAIIFFKSYFGKA